MTFEYLLVKEKKKILQLLYMSQHYRRMSSEITIHLLLSHSWLLDLIRRVDKTEFQSDNLAGEDSPLTGRPFFSPPVYFLSPVLRER